MIVDIMVSCTADHVFPQTVNNMVHLLERLGDTPEYNTAQVCCGYPLYFGGYYDEARVIGEKFINTFSNQRPIIGLSTRCLGYIKCYYPKIFHNTSKHNEVPRIRENIFDITDYLVNFKKKLDLGATFAEKVYYHQSCAAKNLYGLQDEPIRLLEHVRDLELVGHNMDVECCGFGGNFSCTDPKESMRLTELRVQKALECGASYITSTEPTCLLQMQACINQKQYPIQTIHIVDMLARVE